VKYLDRFVLFAQYKREAKYTQLILHFCMATHCNKSSAVAEMGDRGHNRHGPKRGGLLCPFRGELGPRLTQRCLGRGLLLCQLASSSIQPFGHNEQWSKIGVMCPFSEGGGGSPSNTTSPEVRPTSIPSGILMHSAVWPQ